MEFLKIWEILLRRKWVLLIVFLSFFITVVIGTYIIKPVYKATVKILIEPASDPQTALLAALGLKIGGGLNTKSSTSSGTDEYDTDSELAKIKPLLVQLISSLHLKARDGSLIKPEKLLKMGFLRKTILPQPYINVDQYEDASMIKIESYSTNPAEAVKMSNQLAQYYEKDRIGRTKEEYKAAMILVENRIEQVKEEYLKHLSMIRDYKIKEEIVDLDKETSVLINKLSSLQTDYEENEKGILESDKKIALVREKLQGMEKLRKDSEEFSLNDLVKNLQSKRNDFLISMASKTVDITQEHPDYKSLEKQVETIKELLNNEAMKVFNNEKYVVDPLYDELAKKVVFDCIDRETAITRRSLLQRYIDAYQKKLLLLPVKSSVLNRLDADTTIYRDTYQKLLGYLAQINVAESIAMTNINVVEDATLPDEAYFPKKSLNYLVGFFLGIFWGLLVVFFVEYIDNTIKSPEDIKHIKSLNLLGAIHNAKQLADMNTISNLDPTSPIVEAYRTIRNSIKYASVDKPVKTLIITSSTDGEGKSSITSNIAINLSMEDKKVILVDLDLRRPDLHKFFHTPNDRGVTNVLAESMQLKEVIIQTNLKGLDLLPSGPVPSDPGRLVGSQKVKDTIDTLKKMYDMVIIDTPSVMTVNDAIVIGAAADGIVYVIESGKATFSMVEHVQELIAKAGLNLIGVVLNKFRIYGPHYYNRYYKK